MKKKLSEFMKGFGLIFVVFLLIGGYLLIRHVGNTNRIEGNTQPISQTGTDGNPVAETSYVPLTGSGDLLFACADRGQVNFLLRLRANFDEKKITVFAIPPTLNLTYHGASASVNEVYANGGAAALTSCLGGYYGDSFDRYFFCTPDSFAAITRLLGSAEIEVHNDVSYISGNIAINLSKGKNELYGTDLYYYLMHAAEGQELWFLQAEAGASMISSYLSIKNIENGEELFSSIINYADSNITAYDFTTARPVLEAAAASPDLIYLSGGVEELEESLPQNQAE